MNVATKLVGFLVALLVVFGGAVGLGKVIGPVDPVASSEHQGMDEGSHDGMDMGSDTGPGTEGASYPKGLMVSQDGYTFRLAETTVAPGNAVPITFTIEDADGRAVTDYDVEHDKELHLIAVRRDFSGFQHVHPVMDSTGTWKTQLDFTAGQWRLFADFKATGGEALTLGTDVAVRGDYRPSAAAADSRISRVDGYEVTLEGHLVAGEDAKLNLSVTRDGEPVTDLEPYLAAYGHLVALRAGDLAYLHVHPEGTPDDGATEPGPDIVFYAEVPSPGQYHLYLNFKHRGVVRTAAFTVTASGENASEASDTDESESHSGDEH